MTTVLLVMLLMVAIIAVAVLMGSLTKERERQAKLLMRMRRETEKQQRTIEQLSQNLRMSARQTHQMSAAMEARQERMRRTLDEKVSQMQRANDESLEKVRQTVSDKLDGRLNESFKVVNAQLASVHQGLGEMKEITAGMTDLRKLLGGVKTRGVWGEAQLDALMTELFAPDQYVENAAIPEGSMQRVEFALKLPAEGGGTRLLPIDSKFPREDYLRLIEAAEAGDREKARLCAQQLDRAVMEQAKRIHDKYIQPPQTADFAVLFLPTESLYAEVARLDGLMERCQDKYRVLISGPATFCALMTSLQMGFRSVTLERRSGEVLRQLASMKQDFARFDESVQRMRLRLSQAGSELDTLESRARKVVNAIENVDTPV